MKLTYIICLLAVLVLITAQGCQKTAEETPAVTEPVVVEQAPVEETASAKTIEVQVLKMQFEPETITIKAGDTVSFRVVDEISHLLTIGSDRSPKIAKGDIWDKTFEESGTYEVFDAIFKFKGTVIVE